MEKRTTIKGYFDLTYIVLVDVPVRDGKFGPVITLKPEVIERRIAEELIAQRVPLRGREITFLRKVMCLSMEKFANQFGRTSGTVFHWEKNPDKRLDQITEAGLRSLFAELLGVTMPGRYSELRGNENVPDELAINLAKVA